jgi:hypothetical protein
MHWTLTPLQDVESRYQKLKQQSGEILESAGTFQYSVANVLSYCLHEERRHTITNPRPFIHETAFQPERSRKGRHQFDLADREMSYRIGVY